MTIEDSYDIFSTMATNLFAGQGQGDAVVEEGAATVNIIGRSYVGSRRNQLYRGIDVTAALARPLGYSATSNFEMSKDQANLVMAALLNRLGLANELDNTKFYFMQALQLCFAMNSSSVQMPDRATFTVYTVAGDGVREGRVFNLFTDVMMVLGNDARRFFRAFADDTRQVLENLQTAVLKGPSGHDENGLDEYDARLDEWKVILSVANKRGLTRTPCLVHDSAESCSNLTATDRAYLNASKTTIFAQYGYLNTVDNPTVGRTQTGTRPGAVGTGAHTSGLSGLGDGF